MAILPKNLFAGSRRASQAASDNEELGFGGQYGKNNRVINEDGSFNIKRLGTTGHIYYDLITQSWPSFLVRVVLTYITINLLFAIVYFALGTELSLPHEENALERFIDCFYFSTQTLTTVGYGALHPTGWATSMVAAAEALVGLLSFALATGLVYGRFSRPTSGIRFSKTAIIAPFKDGKSLQFRIANERAGNIMEIEAKVIFTMLVDDNGTPKRIYAPLDLEVDNIYFLALNWTIVHALNDKSPLTRYSAQDLESGKAELLILIKAFDDSFSQTIHARHSYSWKEIEFGYRYKLPYEVEPDGSTTFDVDRIDDKEKAAL